MNHVITTYGGGELFTLVFNGIAALFKSDSTGMVIPLIRTSLMIGSVYIIIIMLFKNSLEEGLRWFLWVIVATHLLFLPKTTVFIDDPLTKTKSKIDHVPFALGAFAGLASQVGRSVTEHIESVFTLPDYMPYHQTGTVFASSLMSKIEQFRIVDPIFKGNMERFVNQCVVYDAMIGQKYTLTDLQNTGDIWNLVSSKASPVLGFLYKEDNNPGTITTCKMGAQKLNALWTEQLTKATAFYGNRLQNQSVTKAAFFTYLQNGYQLLAGISESASNLLQQTLMIHAIEESSNNKLSELESPSNYAATKALLQQRSAYAIAGDIAARTLPLFKNVIEALSYALFIFIVVLSLLPNGHRVIITYFGILLWTQLWAPLYAVLNLIMTLYGKAETSSLIGNSGLTLLNSSAIINANADMVTLAAWLSVSIPFISYGILKQGAGAFVGLAQHLGSAMQSAASSAASETVSGNISLGNISMGTQSYQNKSAFQHQTGPTYSASHFKSMNSSGIEQSTFSGGSQGFSDQAISRLSVQIMGTENASYVNQENLNHAVSVANTKSIAASQATETALQNSTTFLNQIGKSMSSGKEWSQSLNSSQAKSLQNFTNFVSDIRQSTGLSETQAVEAAVGASLGGKVLGMGLSGSSHFSSNASREKAIDSAKSIAEQRGYSENLETVLSAAQSVSQAYHDTYMSELGRNATTSLNKANSLRIEAAASQSHVEILASDISSSQSHALSINKDLTQEILSFTAKQSLDQKGESSLMPMGYEKARHILEQGGEVRDSYIKRFQETHPQYIIQGINYYHDQNRLNNLYNSEAATFHQNHSPQSHYKRHEESVFNERKKTELELSTHDNQSSQAPSAQQIVDHFTSAVRAGIAQGKNEVLQDKDKFKEERQSAQEKSLSTTVFKNATQSVIE